MMNHNHDDEERELPVDDAAAEPAPADTAETPETEPALLAEDGAFAPDWYRRFAELEPYAASLAKFRRPEALAKSYAHLERMKGYPAQEDETRMAAFRAAVGLPETAEDFVLERPADTPDEVWNPELVKSLTRVAYDYGVPPRALQALSARYAEEGRRFMAECRRREEEAVEDADAALQEAWGTRYESNMERVGNFLHTMGQRAGVEVETLLENPALRANPDFAKLMLAAAGLMHEAPLHEGRAADTRREAHRIAHDPTHPLHDAYMRTSHPQHRYANEQYDRLAFGRE